MVQQAPELGWGPDDDYEMIQSKSFINTRFASDSDSSDSEDENSNVQLRDDEYYGDKTYFAAGDQGMTPNGVEYVRTLPE